MPRLSEQAVCPAIGKMANRADYDASTFCLHCPDMDSIPSECDLSCGWPTHIALSRQRSCKYVERCPCAQPGSEERIRKMEAWQREHKQRAGYISALVDDMVKPSQEQEDVEIRIGHLGIRGTVWD